ncbi:ras GEF [Amylocystis lapponica]|nr:ras GEF [Amylocystis lapponica]
MPEASDFRPVSPPRSQRTKFAHSASHPSPSPFASQDTFLTARTSPSPDPNGAPTAQEHLLPPSPNSLTPSSSLRKSISVDSFIKQRQSSQLTTRSARGSTMTSTLQPILDTVSRPTSTTPPVVPQDSSSRAPLRDRDKRSMLPPPIPPSRSRGTSVSTIADEESSFLEESDLEHSDDAVRRVRKGKAALRTSLIPPGELPLPSRLQSMNSFPNMNPSQPPSPLVPLRSSSLNHKLARQKVLGSLNTHIPSPPLNVPITIAVVGAAGCGKSTVIKKGLKAYRLSEPSVVGSTGTTTSGEHRLTYIYRSGTISYTPDTPPRVLHVLEVDTAALNLSPSGSQSVWPDGRPSLDALLVCYDSSQGQSYDSVEDVLRGFSHVKLPCVVISCKNDLTRLVDPKHVSESLVNYDVGLVEVSAADSSGKEKMRHTFDWIFKAIFDELRARSERDGYRNPASPSVLGATSPADISRASSATPTASSTVASHLNQLHSSLTPSTQAQVQSVSQSQSEQQTPVPSGSFNLPTSPGPPQHSPSTPASPTRARSTSDLLSEHEKSKREEREQHTGPRTSGLGSPGMRSRGSLNALSGMGGSGEALNGVEEGNEGIRDLSGRESRVPPWMTLDELLDKLLFMAVSDDDPVFISHFLLTYRRFTSPRNILLAMQKRMRALDRPSGDPMFGCFAQMRICLLLDSWISFYPNDFAVPGTAGALAAIIKSILSKTYLLHYGSEFLPFLELVSNLKDRDKLWALKVEDESDDSSIMSDDEGLSAADTESPISSNPSHHILEDHRTVSNPAPAPASHPVLSRERKSSLPLTAKALVMGNTAISPVSLGQWNSTADPSPKEMIRKLCATSQALNVIDPLDIAQEITRIECKFFMQIEPRHWLQHVLVQGRKDPETDPIAKYNHVSNHIADWVVSLILCHDKAKPRYKQIEKFVDVANRLRTIHNYSALRAVIAGINMATYDGDQALDMFKKNAPEHWKSFQSWDQLLQSVRSHQRYRMALRNTKGACIPALEIHLSDLIRAHEGNSDYYDDDPTKIHWAKFNMMGRFIDAIASCQKACRESGGYEFQERRHVRELLLLLEEDMLMDVEMQRSRITPPDVAIAGLGPSLPRTDSRDSPQRQKGAPLMDKIMFWG